MPNQWLERASLRRHGSCVGEEQRPRLLPPLSHTVGPQVGIEKMTVKRFGQEERD